MVERSALARMPVWILTLVAIVALIPRLYVATTTTYLYDEQRDWIPLANSISFSPGSWHTPVRGDYHPALPAYGMALGRALLGPNELGTRAVGIIFGVATVLIVFLLARGAGGSLTSATVAALLLAFNEYHVHVSVLATEKAYYLGFAALSVLFFQRFLASERPGWMFAAAAVAGLSFLSKESGALLGIVFLLTLLFTQRRVWLRRWEPYAAAALFVLVIAPDLWWNATGHATVGADYRKHLTGVGSLGVTYQPLILYGREVISWAMQTAGRPFYDNASEYASGNVLLSLVALGGVIGTLVNARLRRDPRVLLVLTLFLFIFAFFTVVGGRSTPELDAFGFFWGDLSLLGAVVLGGLWAGSLNGIPRVAVGAVLVAGLALSCKRIFGQKLDAPFVAARPDPHVIEDAPGVFRDISISFNFCQTCDQQPKIELVSVRARSGGEFLAPDSSVRLVADAALGTDDRTIRVESSAPEPPTLKSYVVEYRVQPRGAAPYTVRTSVEVRKVKPANWAPWEW
jgi:hypothetical protein